MELCRWNFADGKIERCSHSEDRLPCAIYSLCPISFLAYGTWNFLTCHVRSARRPCRGMQRHDVVALNRATIRDYDTRTEARGVIRDAKRKGVRNIASRIL